MAKRSATKGTRGRAQRTDRPEYELRVRGGINTTDDRIEAELRAPVLDPVMYPKGILRVDINTDVNKKPKLSAVLDAFHVESLLEFVRGQARIRKALEQALKKDQAEWDPDGPKLTPDNIWSRAKIESLQLRRRQVITPELEAHLRHVLPPKIAKAQLAALGDDAATRTSFTLVLKCDWDDEHMLRAEFRDGGLLDLNHE